VLYEVLLFNQCANFCIQSYLIFIIEPARNDKQYICRLIYPVDDDSCACDDVMFDCSSVFCVVQYLFSRRLLVLHVILVV